MPLLDQLRVALASHRQALRLDPANADALFNTAQVLTSLAAAVQEGVASDVSEVGAALAEAVALFRRCLSVQEALYDQTVEHISQMSFPQQADLGEEEVERVSREDSAMAGSKEDQQWASIVEPVTKQSLLDTALALLDTLGAWAIALQVQDQAGFKNIESIGQALLSGKMEVYLESAEEETKSLAWLSVANFKATLSEAEFKHGLINVQTYQHRLRELFETGPTNDGLTALTFTSAFLCSYADTLIAFAAAVADHADTAVLRWTCLTKALECLTQASKIPRVDDLATLHVGRGDVELLRHVLCNTSDLPENLSNIKVQTTLMKNAEVYYRGASSLAQSSMRRSQDDVFVAASIKRAVVASMLAGSDYPLVQFRRNGPPETIIKTVLQEMVDESLVLEETIRIFS